MLRVRVAGAVLAVVGACCLVLAMVAVPIFPATRLSGPPLSKKNRPGSMQTVGHTAMLADRPSAHLPQTILRNINGMWSKSISGRRSKNRKTGGYNLPKQVLKGRGHQWGKDPYMVTQMGLDAGNPDIMPDAGRMMRRMTVRRQWHWDKGSALTGQPGFIASGMVPPKVPILGNAGMKMPNK